MSYQYELLENRNFESQPRRNRGDALTSIRASQPSVVEFGSVTGINTEVSNSSPPSTNESAKTFSIVAGEPEEMYLPSLSYRTASTETREYEKRILNTPTAFTLGRTTIAQS